MDIKKEILKICIKKGFLLDKEMLEHFSKLDEKDALELINVLENIEFGERVITKSSFNKNFEKMRGVFSKEHKKAFVEKFFVNMGYSRMEFERSGKNEFQEKESTESCLKENGKVLLLSSPAIPPKKVEVKDFINYFRVRYESIRACLQERGLENLTSIRKIENRRENFTIIAAVVAKRVTKNKNLILEVEDLTGSVNILINRNKMDVFNSARNLVDDDIVAIKVSGNADWLFGNEIIFPDAALAEKRKSDFDEWVVFTSDIHIGSKMFLEKNFLKFIKWLNCVEGSPEQREIAKKVKYLFLVGDNIDGVGVFPEQEKFLEIKDVKRQYEKLAEYLKLIRDDIKIILCPGQHDAVRVAEPQPIVEERYAPKMHKIKNLTLVSNPSLVEIDGGFKILMYHGASFHGIVNGIEEIRMNYGHDFPSKICKEVLKRRHLSPMHGQTTYIPNEKEDPLLILQIPDIFATGDLHKAEIGIYNNILTIASSCWQSITPFEEKVGNHPEPCKVPLFNLKSREIKILDFSDDGGLEEETCGEKNEKDGDSNNKIVCEVKNG